MARKEASRLKDELVQHGIRNEDDLDNDINETKGRDTSGYGKS